MSDVLRNDNAVLAIIVHKISHHIITKDFCMFITSILS